MYCYSNLFIICAQKAQADYFCDTWKGIYNSDFPGEIIENDGNFMLHIENKMIFEDFEKGTNAITYILMSTAEKYSDVPFKCSHYQMYNIEDWRANAGYLLKYNYSNNILTIELIEGNYDRIWSCEDCDDEFYIHFPNQEGTPIFTFENYDPDKKYVCPICGCDLQEKDRQSDSLFFLMPYYKKYELRHEDSNWILPEGFKIPTDFGELNQE